MIHFLEIKKKIDIMFPECAIVGCIDKKNAEGDLQIVLFEFFTCFPDCVVERNPPSSRFAVCVPS